MVIGLSNDNKKKKNRYLFGRYYNFTYICSRIDVKVMSRCNIIYGFMAQSAVTVRLDSELKSKFDELCNQFGMSANTAFNIFVNAVVRSRSIPFPIKGSQISVPNAMDLFELQRKTVENSEEKELTLDEINAEIRLAREERRKRGNVQ